MAWCKKSQDKENGRTGAWGSQSELILLESLKYHEQQY